jgi:type II secretory pathway pseudopilin PulG
VRKGSLSRRRVSGYSFLLALFLLALMSMAALQATEIDSTLARREREQTLLHVGHEFRQALRRYQAARPGVPGGQYPVKLDDLIVDSRHPNTVRHLRRIYLDPITNKPEWGLIRQGGRIVGVHSLSTLAPIKQSGFDPEDDAFKQAKSYREWVFTVVGAPGVSLPAAAPAASVPAVPSPTRSPN